MSDLFNPIGRGLPGRSGPTLVSGVISDPPRGLLSLAPGTILKGMVLGRGTDGLTTVATDRGTVNVATSAMLAAGSAVTLEVRNAGNRLQVLILSIETPTGRTSPSQQHESGQAGSASSGPAQSGAAGGPTKQTETPPSTRPTGPPPIQVVGSSMKAIVVQAPAAAALLPTPDVEIEVFTPPAPPISIPADAAQKAQILAQARLLVETPAPLPQPGGPSSAGIPNPTGNPAAPATPGTTNPAVTAPTTAPPIVIPPGGTLPNPLLLIEPNLLQPGTTALQPEVATRIAALFAAASAEAEARPTTTPSLGSGVTANPSLGTPLLTTPSPPTATPNTTAGPLLAQILSATTAAPAIPTAPKAAGQILPTGTELTLHVVAVLPTKGGEIEIAPEAAKLTTATAPLIGKVLGYTRAGQAVIDTPAGLLMMQERTRLPVGAQVALVLEPVVAPSGVALPPITNPQQALLFLSRGWPTLDDLLAVLRAPGAVPNDPDTPAPPGLPQTGPKLAAGLATAMAALRTGDIEKLLGRMLAARKIPTDKEETVKRLKDEFAQLSDLAKDRPTVDWRALFLPIYDERVGLTQINLYYRHNNGGENEQEKKDQGTRFLVDVNFAALGAFQLDGLLRGKRFDLMIRSRRRLSRNQRQEIIGIFENALELSGAQGGLEFRTVDVFPVSPLDELRQSHDDLTA